MKKEIYLKIADFLLEKHYGINVSDTELSNSLITDIWCNSGEMVYKAINLIADDCNLDRIDTGWMTTSPLNVTHELAALRGILDEQLFTDDDFVHCPKCGSRTDFIEIGIDEVQLHECLNTQCVHVFIASPDYDAAFDEIDEGLDQSLDLIDERWSDLLTVD